MSQKINVIHIITEHHSTLCSYATGRVSLLDLAVFYGVPFLLGVASWWFNLELDSDRANATIATAAIFAGLLINVLVLIYTVAQKGAEGAEKKLVKEFFANVSYAILLSVVTVVLIMANLFLPQPYNWIWALVIALFTQFCLVLLMSLKRLHALLKHKVGA